MVEGAGVFARGMIIKGRRKMKVRLLGNKVGFLCSFLFGNIDSIHRYSELEIYYTNGGVDIHF